MQWLSALSGRKGRVKVPSRSAQVRESGETAAVEETAKLAKELDEPIKVELPEETAKKFRTPGFSRMRTVWRSEDRPIIEGAKAAVEGQILRNFTDAFEVMNNVYELVRTPATSPDGEILRNQFGFIIWKKTPSGSYEEDWSRLTPRVKENLLFTITTRIFDWELRAADAWGEAMLAKAQWEEAHSIAYDAPMDGTIEARNAWANVDARDERYFAIFTSWYSRRADAIVRTLALIAQRLKDSMTL